MDKKKPRVVREIRRKRISLRPPGGEGHPWDSGSGAPGEGAFHIRRRALDDAIAHCRRFAGEKLEALGLMAGEVFAWKGREYSVVNDVVTTDLDSTSFSVRFDWGDPDIFSELDSLGYDYILVGWYHSHPGYGCFMSATDLETHRGTFPETYHRALVIDPVGEEVAAYRMEAGDCRQVPLRMFEKMDWPENTRRRGHRGDTK